MVDGGKIEDDQRPIEPKALGGGSVEHPPQIAVDQASQLQGDISAIFHQLGTGGPQCSGGIGPGVEQRLDNLRKGRCQHRSGAGGGISGGQGSVDGRSLTGQQVAAETRHGQRCSQRRAPSGMFIGAISALGDHHLSGVERVQPDRATGA